MITKKYKWKELLDDGRMIDPEVPDSCAQFSFNGRGFSEVESAKVELDRLIKEHNFTAENLMLVATYNIEK